MSHSCPCMIGITEKRVAGSVCFLPCIANKRAASLCVYPYLPLCKYVLHGLGEAMKHFCTLSQEMLVTLTVDVFCIFLR